MTKKVKKQKLIVNLRKCTSAEEIDALFDTYDVSDLKKRIKYLNNAMEVTSSHSVPAFIGWLGEYEQEKAIFLEGSWRYCTTAWMTSPEKKPKKGEDPFL